MSTATLPKLLLNINEVAEMVGQGERTIWRWIACNEFPKPDVSMGKRVRRWKPATIAAWVDARSGQ